MAFFRLQLEKCWLYFGYMNPVKGRTCTIDDGGIRDVTTLQTLWKSVELTHKPVYQFFDCICGGSTGTILASCWNRFICPWENVRNSVKNEDKMCFHKMSSLELSK